ncbi:hypothetical protein vseg_001549 [Gypsophila vaccaria]
MPMYVGKEEGQVMDVETAVKDGILGGTGRGRGRGTARTTEKLDLRKMIEELDKVVEVPSVFICPISLEAMQDPVTLCTGQTYERSNILRWLSLGNMSCPTTMQELWDLGITPNNTLHHLIYTWYSHKYLGFRKRREDVQGRVLEILEGLRKVKGGQARVAYLKDLRALIQQHNSNNNLLDHAAVATITSLLGPFTSHAVGSEVVAILVTLSLDFHSNSNNCFNLTQPNKISLIVDLLNEGNIHTKLNCIRLLLALMDTNHFHPTLFSSFTLLVALFRLLKLKDNHNHNHKPHSIALHPALSLLYRMSQHHSLLSSILTINAIPHLLHLFSFSSLNPDCSHLALSVLNNLASLQEGTLALKDFPPTIPTLVNLLMRVSETCTQLALSILCQVCNLAPQECAPTAVEAGLAAKLLLVIQSGCNPRLKQQSAELLKLCSLNYTPTNFISKCKLTRTLQ